MVAKRVEQKVARRVVVKVGLSAELKVASMAVTTEIGSVASLAVQRAVSLVE